MFNLSKFSDKLLKELCDSELNLQKCKLCDFQLLEDINKEISFSIQEARLRNKAGTFIFTLKGKGDIIREEFEVIVSEKLFQKYWPFAQGRVTKARLDMPYEKHVVEIDVYLDRNLIVAEVEFETIDDIESFPNIGKDVTEDLSYKNVNLAK